MWNETGDMKIEEWNICHFLIPELEHSKDEFGMFNSPFQNFACPDDHAPPR